MRSLLSLALGAVALSSAVEIPKPNDDIQHPIPGFSYVYKQASSASSSSSVGSSARFVVSSFDSSKPAVAWGMYNDTIQTNGWSRLELHTNASFSSMDQAFAAGYFEGQAFPLRIWQTVVNQGLNSSLPSVTAKWLNDNQKFMNASIQAYANSDPYWYHVALLLEQQLGVYQGYASANKDPSKALSYEEIALINMVGDLGDLLPSTVLQHLNSIADSVTNTASFKTAKATRKALESALSKAEAELDNEIASIQKGIPRHSTMGAILATRKRVVRSKTNPLRYELAPLHVAAPEAIKLTHCSALIRLNSDASEIFVGHASWAGAETMLRTWKIYDFPWSLLPNGAGVPPNGGNPQQVPGRISSLSGYPGQIPSLDDFIVKSSGLVLTETTIGNNNATLSELYTVPTTVLDWIRSIVAGRLATDGPSWANLFARLNSGTYNDEWMVVDYNKVRPGNSTLLPGTLTVVDQVPGYVGIRDATPELQANGYFFSANTASDPFIFNISGWQPMVQQYGPLFSWGGAPRALIFARDAPKVDTPEQMQAIMRYNNYKVDPLSRMDCGKNPPYSATEAIASRGDLDPNTGDWLIPFFGLEDNLALDAKFTSTSMMAGTVPSLRQYYSEKLGSPIGTTFYARGESGPTHDQVPVFDWRNTNLTNAALGFDTLHLGQPDVFNFTWVTFSATPSTTAAKGAELGLLDEQ